MGRELRIGGKVFDLTEELARRLGKTELEVVELALSDLRQRTPDPPPPSAEQRDFVERILALGAQARRELPPGLMSDHRELYDENGLPR